MNGLFDPRSVAVVGASDDPAKWGYWLARGALEGAGRRGVYLVNGRAGQVQGRPAYQRLADLPEAPELVAIVTPAASYQAVVEDALAAGARYLVGITAGVDRAYPGGHPALAARVRAAGARLLGPTCMGVYDGATDLALTWGTLTPGPIGVISQSGSVGLEIGYLAARAGLGLSRFASVGAQADLTTADLLHPVITAPTTGVVILYLEDLSLGRSLITFADQARSLGKRLILLSVGGSAAGERAITSHTGALATPDTAVDALCDAAGVIRVHTPAQAIHTAQICLAEAIQTRLAEVVPARPRLAVVADSGGQGALAAELAERAGLVVPALSEAAVAALRELLPADAGLTNPIDLAGAGEADLTVYPRVAELVAREADALLLTGYFGSYAADSPALREPEEAAARQLLGTPCFVHTMRTDGPAADLLRTGGIPVFATIDAPVNALAAYSGATEGIRPLPHPGADPATGSAPQTDDTAGFEDHGIGSARQSGEAADPEDRRIRPALRSGEATDSEVVTPGQLSSGGDVRSALAAEGVLFPEGGFAPTPEEAGRLAARLGGTVVLKAVGPAHKTEVGGVVLGLTLAAAVRAEAEQMAGRVRLDGFWVERQAAGGVELIVGAYRDRNLGVLVTVGSGGVYTELLADTATALGPLDHDSALRLLGRTKAARLLEGWRGAPPCDVDAVARAVVAVGRVLAARPDLAELEINPLLARPEGTLALDLLATPGATR
ncbi:CoA-binding protein [Acrocarpospora phusangensis]|uniref:CoA-binding protein n=1 Tax=Acrocarpospora phusangensis TaxID=1070424 RepID=A0A919QF65_9ACTN|nr:acetate--CoA ligase family protein [Acrocarpospora phusangensis]GIH26796.1 CoA-binding protein [Acrocarpospora phusangensis]